MGRPRPTSTTGPKVTVAIGAALLVAAIAVGVLGAMAFVDVMPTDVLQLDGSPGSGVLAESDAPGSTTVELPADAAYTLFLVRDDRNLSTAMDGTPTVTDEDGRTIAVRASDVDLTATMGTTHAEAVASFRTDSAGTYTVEAPAAADGRPARVFVVESTGLGGFIGGIFGGVAGILGAVFLGLASVALLVVGGIMWGVRRGNASRVQPGPYRS